MAHKIRDLPEVCHQLSENQIFDHAKCSKELIDVAYQFFF